MRLPHAREVADYLLQLAAQEEGTTPRTNLELQKHLYYVQGWAIARLGRPMFHEDIEAWHYGPVVPKVYRAVCEYEAHPIPTPAEDPYLVAEDRCFIASVWEDYKGFTASELARLTHEEEPWANAWEGQPHGATSKIKIRKHELASFFESQMPSSQDRGDLLGATDKEASE